MQIQNGSQASFIQQVQARQAFATRPAQRPPQQAEPLEIPAVQPEPVSPRPGMKALPYQEIQQIASRAGFSGLSESDIQQAYLRGESLLTDYRV